MSTKIQQKHDKLVKAVEKAVERLCSQTGTGFLTLYLSLNDLRILIDERMKEIKMKSDG